MEIKIEDCSKLLQKIVENIGTVIIGKKIQLSWWFCR